MSVRIVIEVPNRFLFPLTDRAEASGMTVAEYALKAALAVSGITETRESAIGRLHELGMTDAQIARHLNTTNIAVATKRRQLGLPANSARAKGHEA